MICDKCHKECPRLTSMDDGQSQRCDDCAIIQAKRVLDAVYSAIRNQCLVRAMDFKDVDHA